MDKATRQSWLVELRRNRSKTIDAPLWLWNSIVQLVNSHEVGYLEHCRRYASQRGERGGAGNQYSNCDSDTE